MVVQSCIERIPIKKKMVEGQIFLKEGAEITISKIALCIWRKVIFSATIILEKKIILSFLKMNLKYLMNENNLFVKGFKRLKIDIW